MVSSQPDDRAHQSCATAVDMDGASSTGCDQREVLRAIESDVSAIRVDVLETPSDLPGLHMLENTQPRAM